MLITSLEAFYLTGPDGYVVGGLWKDRRGQELGLDGDNSRDLIELVTHLRNGWWLYSQVTSERFLFDSVWLRLKFWTWMLWTMDSFRERLKLRLKYLRLGIRQGHVSDSDLAWRRRWSLDQMFQTWSGGKGRAMLARHQTWQGGRSCERASLTFELNCWRWRLQMS